ncbi:MAG: alanine racemase [Firmicutes bacterium]|jgi:alanine racemase|nr:alanine racemase [Bacillota bacterium]NLO65980.1 alanine racemase [Bacillota bacterium]
MSRLSRPVWAEISLDNIAFNIQQFRKHIGPNCDLMAVVKANAYGHGALETAYTMIDAGANWMAVALPEEAVRLRRGGITAPILVLGAVSEDELDVCVAHDLGVTVYEPHIARGLSRAAVAQNKEARVHIKVDTGMGRLGLLPDDFGRLVDLVLHLPGLRIEGVFTHFAQAEKPDLEYTQWQWERFEKVMAELSAAGVNVPYFHAANTAATMFFPPAQLDLVRVGLGLYGMYPDGRRPIELKPALQLKTKVAFVKRIPPGSAVSYDSAYVTWKDTSIAVLPIGYGDGLTRDLSNQGRVIINGQYCPIVGKVTMDHTMIDVGDLPVRIGDEVILIGSNGEKEITVDEWAYLLGTINYEVTTRLTSRVERVYL